MRAADAELLTDVAPGTPMHGNFKRYWLPVMRSDALEADGAPVRFTILCEDYVAFRATDGRVGVFDPQCPHRQSSLELANNRDCALTCLFHGWKFHVSGKCLETPNEPDPDFPRRVKIKHYPVREAGGVVWVHFGAGEPPRFSDFVFNRVGDDQVLSRAAICHYNWLTGLEAVLDPSHVGLLHRNWTDQAPQQGFSGDIQKMSKSLVAEIECELTDWGFRYVTGAGRGLRRDYALQLARRGARVVVNDPGVRMDGSGSGNVADELVAAIQAAGGEAIANRGSVTNHDNVKAMVAETVDAWGTVDILINNAGILRDRSFVKKDLSDFRAVLDVHLWGTVLATHAVWPIMYGNRYGRIVVTTSGSGVLGNFGQADYAAAKMAVLGFMNTLAIEGARRNIHVNAIKPAAGTRMARGIVSDAMIEKLKPELITPGVLYLCSDEAPTGRLIQGSGGHFSRVVMAQNNGVDFVGDVSLEDFAAAFRTIDVSSELEPVRHQETE